MTPSPRLDRFERCLDVFCVWGFRFAMLASVALLVAHLVVL